MKSKEREGVPALASIVATFSGVGVLVVSVFVDVHEPRWLMVIGLCCLALAVVFAAPPFYYLKRLGAPEENAAYFSTNLVVDAGPYSVVRHPQYLGYALLVLGFACMDPHWITVALAVCACSCFYAQAILEERFLSQRFGREYDDYRGRVPRFNFVRGLLMVVYRRMK